VTVARMMINGMRHWMLDAVAATMSVVEALNLFTTCLLLAAADSAVPGRPKLYH